MGNIIIEIDSATAEEYNKFSQETRNRFGETVAIALKKIINDASQASYKEFLDAISEEAQRNGLTEDILNELMREND